MGGLGGLGGLGGAAGLFLTIVGGVNCTFSMTGGGGGGGTGGGGGGVGGAGTAANSIGGGGGGTGVVFVFCAISCEEIILTASTSMAFFIYKFWIRYKCMDIPQKNSPAK